MRENPQISLISCKRMTGIMAGRIELGRHWYATRLKDLAAILV